MKYYDRIPANGYLFALSDRGAICCPYQKDQTGIRTGDHVFFDVSDYHEVHLFDSTTEYRRIYDPKSDAQAQEFLFTTDDETETNDFFTLEERQFIRPEYADIRTEIAVVNWFSYSEDDRPYLVNYRLRLIGCGE